MVTIRLTRRGTKNQPFYHVVVTDSRERQGGSSLELVGYFNPVARGKEVRLKLDLERIEHWRRTGAQASSRVQQLVEQYRKEAATPPASAEAAAA
jgi:small subunit ribosomal protein S16